MEKIILIFCLTFLMILMVYWIMPVKKMKTVNEALKSLLQVLPISRIIEVILDKKKHSKN
jgi:hypothetical protein